MYSYIIYNGILNINQDGKVIGVFDIGGCTYCDIQSEHLGDGILINITPYATDSPKRLDGNINAYRRIRPYRVAIVYDNAKFLTIYPIHSARYEPKNPHGYDCIEVSNGILNGVRYYWLEESGTWYKTIFADRRNGKELSMNFAAFYNGYNGFLAMDEWKPRTTPNVYLPEIKNVVISEPYTTIMWKDGSKTQVKCMEGDTFDPEHGFTMAVLKKLMEKPDKPNAYSKWVKQWTEKGLEAGKKQAARKNRKAEKKAEKETCDSCSWTFDEDGNVQTGPTNIDYSNT